VKSNQDPYQSLDVEYEGLVLSEIKKTEELLFLVIEQLGTKKLRIGPIIG
jgi:hypothetical protein